jgi:hypothetical protein
MPKFLVQPRLVSALAVLFMGPAVAQAQGASVSAVVTSARHPLIGDPLAGAAVSISRPRRDQQLTLRFDAERLRGRADRIGVACAGFIRPGSCPSEQLRDEVRLTSVSGGPSFRVLHSQHTLLTFTTDLTLASIRAETNGLTTGGRLVAAKVLWGGRIGVSAAWTPALWAPMALEIGVERGRLMPLVHTSVADGYTPFEGGFNATRLRVGLAW